MALQFARGSFLVLSTDAVGTTYTATIGFQPKAIRFYWMGQGSAVDETTQIRSIDRGMGFATSTSDRRCVASMSLDNTGNATTGSIYRDDAVFNLRSASGRLDVDAILSNGFRLILDVAVGLSMSVFYEAWGGSDIVNAATGLIDEPAATGDQDYTVTGWSYTPSAGEAVVFFAGVQGTSTNTNDTVDSGFCVGAASSGSAANNVLVLGNSDEGSANADTDGYALDGECHALITAGGGNPNARATLTQFNSDGFRLNWIARATTNRKTIYLAIQGGRWAVGSYTIDGSTGGATATVSGLRFNPEGLCLLGRMATESTAGTSATQDRMGLGTGINGVGASQAMGCLDENGVGTMETDLAIDYDEALVFPSTTGTLQSAYDIDQWNFDGFRIIVNTAGGVASEWQGFITFGTPQMEWQPSYPVEIEDFTKINVYGHHPGNFQ